MENTFATWFYLESTFEYIQKLAKKSHLDISKHSKKELVDGFGVEQEHNKDKDIKVVRKPVDALKIALAHLREDPHYYKKLKKAKL